MTTPPGTPIAEQLRLYRDLVHRGLLEVRDHVELEQVLDRATERIEELERQLEDARAATLWGPPGED